MPFEFEYSRVAPMRSSMTHGYCADPVDEGSDAA
jgi:hypothetical protein